jgi:hypothetical protein
VDLSRLGSCEAFGYATVDKLLDDLRADLRGNTASVPVSWKTALSSSLRATSLAAFLLLGTVAASCSDDGGGPCGEATANGVTGDNAVVYCDLVDVINDSGLSGADKTALLDCLPSLDAAYRQQLLDSFQSMDDAAISAYLQDMLIPCGECNDTDCH